MKKKILIIISLVIVLLISITSIINIYMIKSTEKGIISINEIEKYSDIDAILILGCKAYSDRPSEMLAKRLDKGEEIYNILNTKILVSGDHGTKEYDEVNVMKDYLLNSHINSKDIFLDHAGFNTYDSIYRAKNIFGAKKIIIVTQKFHMYRALYLAKAIDIDAYGVLADDIVNKNVQLKNEIREILARDKNFIKAIIKPKSKYLGDKISLKGNGNITSG